MLICDAVAPRLGLTVNQDAVNSVTRGLVGDSSFAVLPDIVPLTCFLLTLGTQIVSQVWLLCRTFTNIFTACSSASLVQTNMGDICWRGHVVWLRFLLVWLARPRESDSARHHTFQPGGSS